jgi:hypothetical protein
MYCNNQIQRTEAQMNEKVMLFQRAQVYWIVKTSHNQVHSYVSLMILPQVHLRKPCYDFYFL